jgi:hypothetical protein
MHKEDFVRAKAESSDLNVLRRVAAQAIGDDGDHDPSVFVRNAIVLSKQAAKYWANCPHVALFDYNSMFLFDFNNPVRFRHHGRTELIPKGCWFAEPDYKHRPFSTKQLTFRRLLWAFVARALVEWKTDEKVVNLFKPDCNVDRHKALTKLADQWAKNEAKARKRT